MGRDARKIYLAAKGCLSTAVSSKTMNTLIFFCVVHKVSFSNKTYFIRTVFYIQTVPGLVAGNYILHFLWLRCLTVPNNRKKFNENKLNRLNTFCGCSGGLFDRLASLRMPPSTSVKVTYWVGSAWPGWPG